MTTISLGDDWVPDACTLPTVEQPMRRDEFDDLFAHDVVAIHHESGGRLRVDLRPDPEVAARAAGLAARETGCCAFFSFYLAITAGAVSMVIEAAPAHADVLAALGARAETRAGVSS